MSSRWDRSLIFGLMVAGLCVLSSLSLADPPRSARFEAQYRKLGSCPWREVVYELRQNFEYALVRRKRNVGSASTDDQFEIVKQEMLKSIRSWACPGKPASADVARGWVRSAGHKIKVVFDEQDVESLAATVLRLYEMRTPKELCALEVIDGG